MQKHGVTIKTPIRDIPEEAMDEIMNGTDERLQIKNDSLGSSNYFLSYEGVAKYILMQQESEASASAQKWRDNSSRWPLVRNVTAGD